MPNTAPAQTRLVINQREESSDSPMEGGALGFREWLHESKIGRQTRRGRSQAQTQDDDAQTSFCTTTTEIHYSTECDTQKQHERMIKINTNATRTSDSNFCE